MEEEMRIKKVAFWDKELEWRFEPIYFSDLALLVGVSGVGKTQILQGILNLQGIANGASLNGLAWDVTFSTVNNVEYRWQGEFETQKLPAIIPNEEDEINKFRIVREELSREGNVIIERSNNEIKFKGETTPKLSPFQSAVEILNQEEDISPVQQAFNEIIYSDNSSLLNQIYGIPVRVLSIISNNNFAVENVQASDMPILLKLALMARHFPDIFDQIKTQFINIFDDVTDLIMENRNIQFILTSHHPYIINNIGMEHWKIVTRKGGVVTVIDAKDLNLGKSRHQAFMQLINLEEYSEGIKV